MGVRGRPLSEWFKSYQVVHINGALSESKMWCFQGFYTLATFISIININDVSNILDNATT